MDKIFFLKIYNSNSGLCNQLYSLIACICVCIKEGKNIIFVSDFLKSIDSNNICPIAEVIDIENINIFLIKYNIRLVDQNYIDNERISLNNINFINILNWDILYNYKELFISFLKELKFSKKINEVFYLQTNKYINNSKYSKINVIHLRIENDAINHWSKINNLTYLDYKDILSKKYIEYIEKYMEKNDFIFVLTSEIDNNVINYLIKNNYNYKVTEKQFYNERELNAIIDFLVGKLCNNIFIGCGNSTFTQCIIKCINNVKNILFDLDNIMTDPMIEDINDEVNKYQSILEKDFDVKIYKELNKDLQNMSDSEAIIHYLDFGKNENRLYKYILPYDFDVTIYKELYVDLQNMSDNEAITHYLEFGINEKRLYKYILPNDFDVKEYKELNKDLQNLTNDDAIAHYLQFGIKEKRVYKYMLPNNFNVTRYKKMNEDLKLMNDKEAIIHYLEYGKNENRKY